MHYSLFINFNVGPKAVAKSNLGVFKLSGYKILFLSKEIEKLTRVQIKHTNKTEKEQWQLLV